MPADVESCPECGAAIAAADGDSEEFEEFTGALREDQWKTYVVVVGAGLVASAGVVYLMLQGFSVDKEKFKRDGPRYANNKAGMQQYAFDRVVPRIERRMSGDGGPEVDCTVKSFGVAGTDKYRASLACEVDDGTERGKVTIDHTGPHPEWRTTLDTGGR